MYQKIGMKVPESLSVMGIDDTELAQYVTPSLSTIRIPYYEEGRKAARELLMLIEEEKTVYRVSDFMFRIK